MDEQTSVLERVKQLSPGERAALRRMAGKPLSSADGQAMQVFFRLLPYDMAKWQEQWFAVLCIACLWRADEVRETRSFPKMLRQYKLEKNMEGMDHRFQLLLDTRWDSDGYLASKLARLARMLWNDDKQCMPDIDQLLEDLKRWNSENRKVQIHWASEYYVS